MNTNNYSSKSSQKTFYKSSIPQDLEQPVRKIKAYSQHQQHTKKEKLQQENVLHQKINEESQILESNQASVKSIPIGERPVSEAFIKTMYSQNENLLKQSKLKYIQNTLSKLRPIKQKDSYGKRCCQSIKKFLPFLKMISNYQWKDWILLDLVSGFSVGMFIIPQGIAYSLLASVAPHYGFYSAFFSMVIYFFLGTSKHLNMSSQGVVSLLVGQTVSDTYRKICGDFGKNSTSSFAENFVSQVPLNISMPFCADDGAKIRIALTLTIFVGIFQLAMGILRLGWLTIYLADPLVSAFTCGAAFHIAQSQIQHLLGTFPKSYSGIFNLPRNLVENIRAIPYKSDLRNERGINWNTIIISIVSLVILVVFKKINEKYIKKIKIPIPIDIIVLVLSLLLSKFLSWETNLGISIVGNIKNGFEAPRLPDAFLIEYVIVNAIVLAIISYAICISVAKSFAVKHGYEVDADQEFVAYGSINFIMSFFSTFATGSSLGCSSMHESLNGKTQMYSTVASIITLVGILTFAAYFEVVPKAVVAAIIMVNIKGMLFKIQEVPALWRINKFDLLIWLVTFAAVVLIEVDIGLGIGVGFSLVTVIYRTQKPVGFIMGRIPGTDIYRSKKKHQVEEIVGIKIFKFEGNLYFASADNFRRCLYKSTGINPKKVLERINRGKPLDLENIQSNSVVLSPIQTNIETVTNELAKLQDLNQNRNSEQPNLTTTMDLEAHVSQKSTRGQYVLNFSYIVLDMSACSFVDSVGIRVLNQIIDDYRALGIEVFLACVVSTCKELFRKAGFYNKTKEDYVFVTVHDAVLAALEDIVEYVIDWDVESVGDGNEVFQSRAIVEDFSDDYKKKIQSLIHQNNLLRRRLDEQDVNDVDNKLRKRKHSYRLRNPQTYSISSNESLDGIDTLDNQNDSGLDQRRQLRRLMSHSSVRSDNNSTVKKLSSEDIFNLRKVFPPTTPTDDKLVEKDDQKFQKDESHPSISIELMSLENQLPKTIALGQKLSNLPFETEVCENPGYIEDETVDERM